MAMQGIGLLLIMIALASTENVVISSFSDPYCRNLLGSMPLGVEECRFLSKTSNEQAFAFLTNVTTIGSGTALYLYSNYVVPFDVKTGMECHSNVSKIYQCILQDGECGLCQALFLKISSALQIIGNVFLFLSMLVLL